MLETSTDKKVAKLKKKLKEARTRPRKVGVGLTQLVVPFFSSDWLQSLRKQTMKLNK